MRALELLGGLLIAAAIGIGMFRLIGIMLIGAMKTPTPTEKEKDHG